jgi:spiro-SPASM protein
MTLNLARRIFEEIAQIDDVRLTIAGIGDPLAHEQFFEIVEAARSAHVKAIHIETDLLPADPSATERLAECDIDVVSIHLPAMTPPTYAAVMGVNRCAEVIENIRRLVVHRQQRRRGTPIVVPTFVKCRQNLAEMEIWYDQWLKALGTAMIVGPSDFAGLITDCSVAEMSPPKRKPCGRLWSRMTILSDGKVVSCEQDVAGRQVVGDASSQSLQEIWQKGLRSLRESHKKGCFSASPTCAGCREWHRP